MDRHLNFLDAMYDDLIIDKLYNKNHEAYTLKNNKKIKTYRKETINIYLCILIEVYLYTLWL